MASRVINPSISKVNQSPTLTCDPVGVGRSISCEYTTCQGIPSVRMFMVNVMDTFNLYLM